MKITQQQLKGMIAEELAALDEDFGKAVLDAIMDKFRSKPEPEPEEEPEPEPEEKPKRRPYDHNHPDHPDHPDNIRARRQRRQSAADSKAYWSRTTDDIYGKRYKNPKGQFRQYTAGGYTREHIERIIKEELQTVLTELEDMSRKGNAGEDFAIPSAAWDRAFRKNGIKISYHGRMGVERDEWSKDKAQEYSGITYWPLYPVKGGYMGAYGRIYNALSDSGGGHALNLVDDAIEEARKMCERGEYTKTGRYETSGVTPGACKKMGWITPAE